MSKENLSAVQKLMEEIKSTPEAFSQPEYDAVDKFLHEDDPTRTVKEIFYIMEHTMDYFMTAGRKEKAHDDFLKGLKAVPAVAMRQRRLW